MWEARDTKEAGTSPHFSPGNSKGGIADTKWESCWGDGLGRKVDAFSGWCLLA